MEQNLSKEEIKEIEEEATDVCHVEERYKKYENVDGGGNWWAYIDGATSLCLKKNQEIEGLKKDIEILEKALQIEIKEKTLIQNLLTKQ